MSDIQADEVIENEIVEEQVEGVPETVQEDAPEAEAKDEGMIVTIGEESPPPEEMEQAQAPAWVKELRKNHRDLQKKNRELEEKLKATQTPQEVKVEVGQKPRLEDHDYDADKYEEELSKWYDRKKLADEHTAKVKREQEASEQAWQDRLTAYGEAKSKLKVEDYEDAEHAAQEVLSKTQQGIILHGAENPALLVYALGKNPAKAKELAAIKDPVKYAFAVAKLETQLKVTPRKAPPPESSVSKGSAAGAGGIDSTLERLRAEAERSGDYTKVSQYKRQKRG